MSDNFNYNVLIVEDHPIIQSAYKDGFMSYSKTNDNVFFNIETVENCSDAVAYLQNCINNELKLDIVFLDIRIPCDTDKNFLSGEDIGAEIRCQLPDTKIIISTSLNDNYRVHSIMQSVNPDAFIIKNDFDAKGVLSAIENVLKDQPYYSKSVLRFLRQQVSTDLLLDKTDRQILYELSVGTKMKDLPKVVPLSLGGIEKRKRHLKQLFNLSSFDDRELILRAKEKGFI